MMVLLGGCDEFKMAEEMGSPKKSSICGLTLILLALRE